MLLEAVLVLFLAPDECLVDFYFTRKCWLLLIPRLTKSVRQVPRRLLRDAQVSMELDARNSLGVGVEEIDGNRPGLVAKIRAVHHGICLDREELVAATTTIWHLGVSGACLDVGVTAIGAGNTVRPALFDKPRFRGGIIGELSQKLGE